MDCVSFRNPYQEYQRYNHFLESRVKVAIEDHRIFEAYERRIMSYQHLGQYEAKAFSFEEFTEIFRNSLLLQVLYAGYGASICWTIHSLVFSSGADADMATITIGALVILLFIAGAAIVTNSVWKKIQERREVAFLIGQIKKKYDTTGMVFNDRFEYYRKVTGTLTSANFSKPIDVIFVFHTPTNEAMYLGSHASVDFYPTPLFGAQAY